MESLVSLGLTIVELFVTLGEVVTTTLGVFGISFVDSVLFIVNLQVWLATVGWLSIALTLIVVGLVIVLKSRRRVGPVAGVALVAASLVPAALGSAVYPGIS